MQHRSTSKLSDYYSGMNEARITVLSLEKLLLRVKRFVQTCVHNHFKTLGNSNTVEITSSIYVIEVFSYMQVESTTTTHGLKSAGVRRKTQKNIHAARIVSML